MASFICPGFINFSPIFRLQIFLFNAGGTFRSLQSNAKLYIHQQITLEKYELLRQISTIFLHFSAVEASSILFNLKQVSTFKENLPVIPLHFGLVHIMKCSCIESAYIGNLVLCKAITNSENGRGWEGPLEGVLSKMRQAQLE